MTRTESFPPDPLIDEVRQRRRDFFAACDNDFKKYCERIKQRQAEHPERIVDLRKIHVGR